MPNHLAIQSFSQSLAEFFTQSYGTFKPDSGTSALPQVRCEAIGSAEFNSDKSIENKITLYLHRITTNNHLRSVRAGRPVGAIGLDLHYLLTIWVDNVADEHALMGWAIRNLHYHSFLDGSSLSKDAGWAVDETISIMPDELTTDEMSRIWDMARRSYRLSFPFVARIVRIAQSMEEETAPVVATRFTYSDNLLEREA